MNPNNGRYRFVFLGFLFPVFHYVIMLAVQVTATVAFSLTQDLSAAELEKKALVFLNEYSDVFSLVSALLTLLLVLIVYWMISARFQQWQMPAPSVKTYFSLKKISKGLVCKLVLLGFFFYHLVLGFLNLIGLLAPSLMESYRDAAQSVDTGTSAFSLVVSFLALVIAAPIIEELIYRNMAIDNLSSRLPKALSVVLSSVIFGIFHGNLVWMLYAGALGLLFGFLYVKSESVYVSLVVHTTFNLIGYVYSVLGNFVSGSMISVMNSVSFSLMAASLIGVPLVLWWVWLGLSEQKS